MSEAVIVIELIPEAKRKSRQRIEKEIAKSLQCDWLLKVENVAVSHHPIPNNKKVIPHV
jgi:hypothetical protein